MAADLRTQLESSLGSRYTIERELAGGGIARVFLANETALGRRVVIKVLSGELAAGLSAKRFEREIRLAASLQQANIVPLLAADQTGEVPYYAMPFVEGLSLRDRLDRGGQVGVDQTIAILRDVARALAYAHEHGVVHRDIKPDNVLLSGDAAVVTDFGIAKAISAASTTDGAQQPNASTVTQAGTAVGTPAYMAPEQMSADPSIDHRADLYSFGCLAYELLTGQPPFRGSFQALFAAHLSEPAPRVAEKYPECPPALANLVMQCLEKDPVARPQSAREILRTLDGVMDPATGITRVLQRLSRSQRVAATVLLLAVSLGVVATLLRGRSAATGAATQTASIAVIPFLNVTGDSTDEYLADGIADELATALGKVPRVRVVSRSLSYRFKGRRGLDVRQVGRELESDHLLQGTVLRVPGGLRISAHLTNTSDNNEMWSETYVRGVKDALVFQDSITRAIAGALRRRLAGDSTVAVRQLASRTTSNAEAYDLYLRGRFLLLRRGPGVRQAVEKFEQAIANDSNFAGAHAGLALALELMPYFEPVSASAIHQRAVTSAQRALRIDSALAEAHTALAMAHQHAYEWQQADVAYQRAVAIDSSGADTHIQYGRLLFYTGRFAEAQTEFERARALDPYSAVASGWVGHMLMLSGRGTEARAELRRAMEIDSTNPPLLVFLAEALLDAGQVDQSRALMERLWNATPAWRPVAAQMLAIMGDRERASELVRSYENQQSRSPVAHTVLTMLHLALGDTTRALDALERATDFREIWPTFYSVSEPFFDPVRHSARFARIIRRVGLNERVFTSPNGGRPR
jgi:eukaryotic-like serine/threonine-protein kinase